MRPCSAITLVMGFVLGGCSESSTQQLDADQQDQLNVIAAHTPETAGNAIAQGGGTAGDVYRSGAAKRGRKY